MILFARLIIVVFTSFLAQISLADKLPLAQISKYLNDLKTVEGNFTQVNDDGTISTGILYIKRPGKMRLEYDPPNNALVIASNKAVYIIDKKSNQMPETYPLRRTPLSIILAPNVNLSRQKMVVGHDYDGTATIITAQDPKNTEYGSILMKFSDEPVQLRQWIVRDSSGGETTIVLETLTTGVNLSNRLFDLPSREREN